MWLQLTADETSNCPLALVIGSIVAQILDGRRRNNLPIMALIMHAKIKQKTKPPPSCYYSRPRDRKAHVDVAAKTELQSKIIIHFL